jgi:transcriptional antiterminator RfaH
VTERAAHWNMIDKNLWYVIYTRSRQEKVLASQLEAAGFEVYLPLINKVSKWSDRKKVVEVPLFNSYVFIKDVCEKYHFKNFKSFVTFLNYNGKPAIVKQHEIDILKTIIKNGYDIGESSQIEVLSEGSEVMVLSGPLKGLTGKLISVSNNDWFVLNFENMGSSLQVKIAPNLLKKI